MNGNQQFQRLNFFQGLFTTAQDWTDEQHYHVEKAKLANRILHRPGVAEGLTVQPKAATTPGLTVVVNPGVALDANGNVIYLAGRREVTVIPGGDAEQPLTVRLKLRVTKDLYFTNVQDPEYSDFTRQVEDVHLAADRIPATPCEVVLARINVGTDAVAVTVDDIDTTGRVQIGAIDTKRDADMHALATKHDADLAALETKHDADLIALKERFLRLSEDHLARQRRHNRGLHTVGVLHKIPSADEQSSEFSVRANGGMSVTVWPGAAIDAAGNEIFLDAPLTLAVQPTEQDKRVYVVVSYVEHFAAYLEDLTQPFTNQACTAQCQVTDVPPDNETWLALARIDLAAGVFEIREPVDPVNPQPNEIDRRVRIFSGAVAVQPTYLDPPVQRHLVQTMLATRHHFAALTGRFPTPSLDDVRYGAVHLQMTATSVDRVGAFNALNGLSLIEETTESELAEHYPALVDENALMGYKGAINELRQALLQEKALDTILTAQQAVAEAALLLSEVVFPPPVAVAGGDQQVTTLDAEATVTLDGSGSEAGPGRKIVNYRWDVV